MNEFHTTRDGEKMLIAQMTDQHLSNTISLLCRDIAQAAAVLNQGYQVDPVTQALSGINTESVRAAAEETVRQTHAVLSPYVFEAALRGLRIQHGLQSAYGRSGQIILQHPLPPGDD